VGIEYRLIVSEGERSNVASVLSEQRTAIEIAEDGSNE